MDAARGRPVATKRGEGPKRSPPERTTTHRAYGPSRVFPAHRLAPRGSARGGLLSTRVARGASVPGSGGRTTRIVHRGSREASRQTIACGTPGDPPVNPEFQAHSLADYGIGAWTMGASGTRRSARSLIREGEGMTHPRARLAPRDRRAASAANLKEPRPQAPPCRRRFDAAPPRVA